MFKVPTNTEVPYCKSNNLRQHALLESGYFLTFKTT